MTRKIVGFDRKIEREWLDFAAAQASRGLSAETMRSGLWEFLEGQVSAGSSGWNSDRGKTITVLMRIWGPAEGRHKGLRERALQVLSGARPQVRLRVHWALCLASYSFFENVARVTGQLLALHGEVQSSEVRRRLIEEWGDRAVVQLASRRILRSMTEWGVLRESEVRGGYRAGFRDEVSDADAGGVLLEGLLLSDPRKPIPATKVASYPSLFPFRLRDEVLRPGGTAGPIQIEREGLGMEYVRLAEN